MLSSTAFYLILVSLLLASPSVSGQLAPVEERSIMEVILADPDLSEVRVTQI